MHCGIVAGLEGQFVAAEEHFAATIERMHDPLTRGAIRDLLVGSEVLSLDGGIELSWLFLEADSKGAIALRNADPSAEYMFVWAVEARTDSEIDATLGVPLPIEGSFCAAQGEGRVWRLFNCVVFGLRVVEK